MRNKIDIRSSEPIRSLLSRISIFSFCIAIVVSASHSSRAQLDASSVTQSEQADLRAQVEKFFAAYASKDLDRVVGLWSAKSPDLARQKRTMQRQFTTSDLSFDNPSISRINIQSDKADMRVTVGLTTTNIKTKYKREQRLVRAFEWVKENGEWRVWRYAVAAEGLAVALVKANSDVERAQLMAADKELVTAELVQAVINQAARYIYEGDFSRALAIDFLGYDIAQQIGDKSWMALTLSAIGGVFNHQESNEEALEYFQRSIALSTATGDKYFMARTLGPLGDLEQSLGDYVKAMEHLQESLRLSQEAGDDTWAALVLGSIGNVHRQQGNYDQALDYLRKSAALAKAADDKVSGAHIMSDVARVYTLQGKYDEALAIYNESLARLTGSGHDPGTLITLSNMGEIHFLQGKYDQALDEYGKSLSLSEATNDRQSITTALCAIADVYRAKGDYKQALKHAERASGLAREVGFEELFWDSRMTAGKSYVATNQPAEARRAFEEAIATIETLRNQIAGGDQDEQRFFESRIAPYEAMVELMVSQDNPGVALAYAERAKGRVLLDVVRNGHVNINKAMTSDEQQRERKLKAQLVSLNSQIYSERLLPQPDQKRLAEMDTRLQKARLDFEVFQTALYSAHPELKTRRGEARPLKLDEASLLIPDDQTALLEFVSTEEKTYLFVLTKRNPPKIKVYRLNVCQKELTDRVENYRQMLSTLDNRFSKPAHELYDLLLDPAKEQLQGKTKLIVVPDGALWELPFQTLQNPRGRYLIDDHSIFYAPSLTVLREMIGNRHRARKSVASPTLLAMGNPVVGKHMIDRVRAVHMDERLDSLPESEAQVRSLGELYGPDRSKVYVGEEAREERFKSEARNFSIIHLATHGILNDHSPMYSQLLLAQTAPGSKEDGVLEAWELMGLDLKADVAVLSACETARGRVGRGEGMIGLSWALFVAGVPTTVVSQWKVRSDSTAELMVEFHKQLKARLANESDRNSTAEALRIAALKLKANRKYQHPFHWAGFVVIGDAY